MKFRHRQPAASGRPRRTFILFPVRNTPGKSVSPFLKSLSSGSLSILISHLRLFLPPRAAQIRVSFISGFDLLRRISTLADFEGERSGVGEAVFEAEEERGERPPGYSCSAARPLNGWWLS
ncbi:hypothetical protein BUALT_Bualt06G0021100 [Buddleja alternifolia]|uniref:Uncharacterized protein n=1 Tax=Buddleja alternifolia TaxID=168488 RepID=A0AAV6XDF4_9LAMI|nr:hypothetical protein BUALT_Bualt06G0021100 [Buddleja alternifolia]